MSMTISEILGVATAIVGLAVVAVVITNGGKTAAIIGSAGNAFAGSIKAATGQSTKVGA